MGPLSSMGSPMTFIILPRVSGPTGILMGAPVSRTFCPRTRPSVPSIAMVRTVFSPAKQHEELISCCMDVMLFHTGLKVILSSYSPRCCATSRTSLDSRPATSRAFRMGGRSSSNWTSTTAPMTATMRPAATVTAAAGATYSLPGESCRRGAQLAR